MNTTTNSHSPRTSLHNRWLVDDHRRLYGEWALEDGGMHQPVESTVDDDRAA
jgi:hypothetical protein